MWIVTVICLLGTALNVKKARVWFLFWGVGNLAWFIYDIWTGLYSRAVLDLVQLGFSIWGYYEWRDKGVGKDKKKAE